MSDDAPCHVIAVANMKGGVGKTTTVVSLAEAFGARDPQDARVLVVDLDPQASASFCLLGDDYLAEVIEHNRTLQTFLEARLAGDDTVIADFICPQFSYTIQDGCQLPVDILATGNRLRTFERDTLLKLTRKRVSFETIRKRIFEIVRNEFSMLEGFYTHVLFDCPPGLSLVAEAAIGVSDLVIVPTVPDEVSNFGLSTFCETIWEEAKDAVSRPPLPYVLLNRVLDTKQHKTVASIIEAHASEEDASYRLLKTRVRQSTELSKAIAYSDHGTYQGKYPGQAGQTLDDLADEVEAICEVRREGR